MIPLDPDRTLALAYVPASRRAAVEALWRLDAALASTISTGREPLITEIRLTWWRDSLEKLDRERAPSEPVLQGLSRQVLPAGVSGEELSAMAEGWKRLLSPDPLTPEDLEAYGAARGGLLFRFSARLLGGERSEAVERSGAGWALADLARHSSDEADGDAAAVAAGAALEEGPKRWPPALRPLGMLAALAERDVELGRERMEEPGAPSRMLRMLRHRLSGR